MTDSPLSASIIKFGATFKPAVVGLPPAALAVHIGHIVALRSKPKMGRIYASRIVALVQYIHTVWHRAVMQLPTDMRRDNLLFAVDGTSAQHASTRRRMSTLPWPALVRVALVNLLPKSFGNGTPLTMPAQKAHRLAFNPLLFGSGFSSDPSGLAAATFTKFGFLRGIIEGHHNLQLWCLIRERFQSLPGIFACSTPVIIAQVSA